MTKNPDKGNRKTYYEGRLLLRKRPSFLRKNGTYLQKTTHFVRNYIIFCGQTNRTFLHETPVNTGPERSLHVILSTPCPQAVRGLSAPLSAIV
jgi:hypothetical protein